MRDHDLSHEYREQRETIRQLLRPQPTVIAIEGGPCSGKTTLINRLEQEAGDRKIVCLPEAATDHILQLADQGIDVSYIEQHDRSAWVEFEKSVLQTIVTNIDEAKELYADTDAIIVMDRCDIGAYVTPDEYTQIQEELGLDVAPMLSHVDQLYYLPSVASIEPEIYLRELANNPARLESLEKAQAVCGRNLKAIGRHPELHITWGGDFDANIDKLVASILNPEGESEVKVKPRSDSEPIQRFFDEGVVVSQSAIEQTYFELDDTVFRLRRTVTEQGETLFFFTIKTGEGIHRHEVQRRIDLDTFKLLKQCRQVGEPLVKERSMVLTDDGGTRRRVWALDRYFDRRLPEWNIETDVETDEEAEAVLAALPDFESALFGAEKLARSLGARAIKV